MFAVDLRFRNHWCNRFVLSSAIVNVCLYQHVVEQTKYYYRYAIIIDVLPFRQSFSSEGKNRTRNLENL